MPDSRLDSAPVPRMLVLKAGSNCTAEETSWPHCQSEKVRMAPAFFQLLVSFWRSVSDVSSIK